MFSLLLYTTKLNYSTKCLCGLLSVLYCQTHVRYTHCTTAIWTIKQVRCTRWTGVFYSEPRPVETSLISACAWKFFFVSFLAVYLRFILRFLFILRFSIRIRFSIFTELHIYVYNNTIFTNTTVASFSLLPEVRWQTASSFTSWNITASYKTN